jgi:hypothetical protein
LNVDENRVKELTEILALQDKIKAETAKDASEIAAGTATSDFYTNTINESGSEGPVVYEKTMV